MPGEEHERRELEPRRRAATSDPAIAAELGTVVIGGLFSSTFLTLLVVPAVYFLIEGAKGRLGQGRDEVVARTEPMARPVAQV